MAIRATTEMIESAAPSEIRRWRADGYRLNWRFCLIRAKKVAGKQTRHAAIIALLPDFGLGDSG
jgi:hypothetical protein